MKDTERTEVLQNLVASVAVLTWTQDLEMSCAIMDSTAEKYGKNYVNDLMLELMPVLSGDTSGASKDVFLTVAMLALIRPLPNNWSQTKN